ncbi:hypothetical protein RMCBS344292_17490 [Rhizopus microsporus]|nr:hypothetical protein RMCBS344292_17490 [Rhizopus microsporus]
MTEFNYPLAKENAKTVPLYHHEQVPFQSFYKQNTVSNQAKLPADQNVSGDLQDIIYSYQSQPELLKLILSSKLEEDKRRAEEAKLRAKELDLLLIQQQLGNNSNSNNSTNNNNNNNNNDLVNIFPLNMQPMNQSPVRRPSLDAILSTPLLSQHRRDSTFGSSFTSDELDDQAFSPITSSTATTTPVSSSALLHMESYPSAVMSSLSKLPDENAHKIQRYSIPPRPRRRREMQAITKIVETREYPYIDGYFWKNNGNTIQKKTGNKSVYYKCSNSNKGCPVNKTVTWKGNGEYLIKYRGEHLLECNKVQRIVDV